MKLEYTLSRCHVASQIQNISIVRAVPVCNSVVLMYFIYIFSNRKLGTLFSLFDHLFQARGCVSFIQNPNASRGAGQGLQLPERNNAFNFS